MTAPVFAFPASTAATAAPTMPASLSSCAGTIGARVFEEPEELLRLLADAAADDEQVGGEQHLERDGGTRRPAEPHFFQLSFLFSRTISDARFSASLPRSSRWPSSVLGTRAPSTNNALPMPVPSVTIITTPCLLRPAPKRISARPAASASLSTTNGRPTALPSALGDVLPDPRLVDVGGGLGHAPADHGRERRADGAVATELGDDLGDDVGDGRRHGGLRGQQPVAVGGERPPLHVDRGALDARPPDVDPEHLLRHDSLPTACETPPRLIRNVRRADDAPAAEALGNTRPRG